MQGIDWTNGCRVNAATPALVETLVENLGGTEPKQSRKLLI
jgi:hypothetical protein